MRAEKPAGPNGTHPSSPSPNCAKRNGDTDFAAQSKKYGEPERKQPAADFRYARGNFRIDFGNNAESPQNEHQHKHAEDESGHGYFSWANNFCAPDERFFDRSTSALMPPAA